MKSERRKFGSADSLIIASGTAGPGDSGPSTAADLRRLDCLEMSNSASLDHLAVYDQQLRKLSVQVCRHLLRHLLACKPIKGDRQVRCMIIEPLLMLPIRRSTTSHQLSCV